MSGQRVRGADSGAASLTTPSHALSKEAEVVTKALNVLSGQTCTQRESQELFSFTHTDAVETASVGASLGRITRATNGSISAARNK